MTTRRIALFGGSFDPIHFGHLWVAQHAIDLLEVDQVVFIPTATSPLKRSGPIASDSHRLTMLQIALSRVVNPNGERPMIIDAREIHRGDISYTVDTVEQITKELACSKILMLLGSDCFSEIGKWHLPEKLLKIVTPVVYRRSGSPEIDWMIRRSSITIPMIELSSSEIRYRVALGRSVRFMVPEEVLNFIEDKSLYKISFAEKSNV
jgi:nicotinate-nucleotide adenylyltransferase